jgi:hypothetical protein
MSKSKRRRAAMVALATAFLATGVWAAEEATVQRHEVYVLKGKGSIYLPPLATAPKGATLEVLAHEGRWLKVQYTGVEGYVLESALNGESNGQVGGSSGGGGSSDATAAAAARGFGEQSVAWENNHNYSRDGLISMIATRQRIAADPAGFEQFKTDGHVGAN